MFRDEKELRVANTWFQKYRIVTHSAGESGKINNSNDTWKVGWTY